MSNNHVMVAEKYPQVLKDWDYDKNGDINPYNALCTSNQKRWWKCEIGHRWMAYVHNRVKQKQGCPICFKISRNDRKT